jgi:NitT/TauT family transport system substrate-binding protein
MVSLLLVAACGSTSSGATGGGTQTDSLKLKDHVTITELRIAYYGLEHIASAEGLFEKYNLTVNLLPAQQQGASVLSALLAGQAQTTQSVGITTVVTGVGAGLKVVGVASGAVSGPNYDSVRGFTRISSGISSPQDLVGKKIGMLSTVGYYGEVTRAYLKKGGVDPSKVTFLAVPQSALIGALTTNQVDAIVVGDAVFGTLETEYQSTVKRLFRDQDVTPAGQFSTTYMFLADYAVSHPDIVRAFVAGLKDAADFVKKNKAKAAQDIANVEQVPVANIVTPDFPAGLCMNLDGAKAWLDYLISDGYAKSNADLQGMSWVTNQYNKGCN